MMLVGTRGADCTEVVDSSQSAADVSYALHRHKIGTIDIYYKTCEMLLLGANNDASTQPVTCVVAWNERYEETTMPYGRLGPESCWLIEYPPAPELETYGR
jgi:hypothetical protein